MLAQTPEIFCLMVFLISCEAELVRSGDQCCHLSFDCDSLFNGWFLYQLMLHFQLKAATNETNF